MFILTTRGGETRRLEIPADVERAGQADAFAANPPAEAWKQAAVVPWYWPATEPPAAAPTETPVDAAIDEPTPITDASSDALLED